MSKWAFWRKKTRYFPSSSGLHSIVTWEQGHVRAAVLRLAEGTAEILGAAAAPVHGVGGASHPDVDRWATGCDRALTQAEETTAMWGRRRVVADDATMSVPTEISRTLSVETVLKRRNRNRGITQEELCQALERGYRQAQDEIGKHNGDQEIVCGSLAEIALDGQPILDPIGLQGDELTLRLCFFLLPIEWLRALEVVADRLKLRLSAIVPHQVAYAAPIEDPAALMMVVESQHSVVGLVRRGALDWAGIVPMGEHKLIGAVTEALHVPDFQAGALMRAYRAGQLREDVELRLARAYWAVLRRWMVTVADEVRRQNGRAELPHRIYFYDQTRRVPEIMPALETPFWEKSLPFARCPEVLMLSTDKVQHVIDSTAQTNGPVYLLLRSLAHYVARLHAPANEMERALMRTVRWRRGA